MKIKLLLKERHGLNKMGLCFSSLKEKTPDYIEKRILNLEKSIRQLEKSNNRLALKIKHLLKEKGKV